VKKKKKKNEFDLKVCMNEESLGGGFLLTFSFVGFRKVTPSNYNLSAKTNSYIFLPKMYNFSSRELKVKFEHIYLFSAL